MDSRHAPLSPGRANLALATLFLGMFVMGSAELLVVGVLNLIADGLQVSIPEAGRLVTAYALGLAIGGPILTSLTIKLNKRAVLAGALGGGILANLVLVLTTDYGMSLAARTSPAHCKGCSSPRRSRWAPPSSRRSASAGRWPWSSPVPRSRRRWACRWAR